MRNYNQIAPGNCILVLLILDSCLNQEWEQKQERTILIIKRVHTVPAKKS